MPGFIIPWLKTGSSIVLILSGIYLLVQPHLAFLPYIQSTDIQKLLLVFGEILAASITLELFLERSGGGLASWPGIIFLFLFLNLLLLIPFASHYLDPIWEENPGTRRYRELLLQAASILLPLTAASALAAAKSICEVRIWLREKLNPEPRHAGTGKSRIQRTADLSSWLKKEWALTLLLLLLIAGGVLLRQKGLTDFIMDDETHHLAAAADILEGSGFSGADYKRSLYTVTAPLVASFRMFGTNLLTARWTAIFFNTLAVLPLYILLRRYSRQAALASAAVYLLNPWMIASASLVREYAFAPFYLYTAALLMGVLYDSFPADFVISRDYNRLFSPRFLFPAAILLLFLLFMLLVDPHSTFKVSTAMYLSLAVLLTRKVSFKHRHNLWLLIIPAAAAALLLPNLDLFEGRYSGFTFSGFDTWFLSLFFSRPVFLSDPIQQANFGYGINAMILAVISLAGLKLRDRRRFSMPFSWLTFLITIIAFTVFTIPGHKPRFATYIQIWYIPIMANGLYAGYVMLRRFLKPAIIPAAGIFLMYFNLPYVSSIFLEKTTYQIPGSGDDTFRNGTLPVMQEYFSNPEPALRYLMENMKEGDALITTNFIERYLNWNGFHPVSIITYDYTLDNDIKNILAGISSAESGWIALDYERGYLWSDPLPLDEFVHDGRHVDWKGWKGDTNIYYWYPVE